MTHSAAFPLSHYLTQRLEMNFTARALSSLHSTILQLLLHIALIVSLLCSLKEGENQFYSTLSPIKWHTSDLSCFFPFYLLKKEGPKSIFGLCFYFKALGILQRSGTLHHSASAALHALKASQCISIQVVSFVSFWGTLVLCILPMCPLWMPASGSIVKGLRVLKGHLQ